MSTPRAATRSEGPSRAPAATFGARFGAWLVDLAIVAALFSGLWLFGLIRISGCEGFDTATNSFPSGCPFESTREVDGEIVYVLDSGRELPADHPTAEVPLLGIRVVDPPGASAYLVTLVYALAVFVVAQGVSGVTPGKWLTGIRLAGEDGEPLGVPRAAVRWLVPDGAVGLLGVLVALAGGPWVLRLLAADGVLRLGNSLAGLLSGAGTGPGDRMAGAVVTTASAFALGEEDDDFEELADTGHGGDRAGAAWSSTGWQPAPSSPPTAEQPVVPPGAATPPEPASAPSTPWAMPASWPDTAGRAEAPGTAPAPAEGTEAGAQQGPEEQGPGLRFPWMAEPGTEPEEPEDEGWTPPTMQPVVDEEEAPEVPAAEAIVGSSTPEPAPAVEAAGAPTAAPGGAGASEPTATPLPAVAPSAMPATPEAGAGAGADADADARPVPGDEAERTSALPAVAPSAMPGADAGPAPASPSAPAPGGAGTGAGAEPGGGEWPAGQPVWDPAREAYIYWDPAKNEWLQFDYATGDWGPISRAGG